MCVCVCVLERQRELYVCAIETFRTADVLVARFYKKKSVLRALKFVTATLHRLGRVLCSSNVHQRAVVDN